MDLILCSTDGDLARPCCWFCGSWCFWLVPKFEAMAMVPIMTLRRTKKTVGVNQLFMEAQIETDSSNMAFGGYSVLQREREGWGKMKMEVKKKGRNRKLSASASLYLGGYFHHLVQVFGIFCGNF